MKVKPRYYKLSVKMPGQKQNDAVYIGINYERIPTGVVVGTTKGLTAKVEEISPDSMLGVVGEIERTGYTTRR